MSDKLPGVGITLDIRNVSGEEFLSLAREADEAGLYAVAAGDATHDTLAMLSAFAAVTRRIRLVSSIATWTRTPVTMARACRTLGLLSNGRYALGMGSMPPHFNEQFHGIPYKAPLDRMSEYIELIRLLWEATPSTPVDYQGQFYQVSGYRVTEPPPHPLLPILIGASRPRMISMTGEKADGVILNVIHSIRWLREVALPALSEGAERSGRSLEVLDKGISLYAIITDEPEQARTAMRRTLAFHLSVPYGVEWLSSNGFSDEAAAISAAQKTGDRRGVVDAVSDRVLDTMGVVGTPEECRERLAQYSSLIDWVLLAVPPALPPAEQVSTIRRLIKTFGSG